MPKPAQCHPDSLHHALGLCKPCYRKAYQKRPGNKHTIWNRENYDPEYHRVRSLKLNYNLTPEQKSAMLEAQNHTCPACLNPLVEKDIVIDHDHACCPGVRTCGKCIRGLIHRKCNRALGIFGDSPQTLRTAAAYLEKHLTKS